MFRNPPMRVTFRNCQIFLKICILSNLMVLILFLTLFSPPKAAVTPLRHLISQNVKTVIFKSWRILLKICILSYLMVPNSFLTLFWPPKSCFDPTEGILTIVQLLVWPPRDRNIARLFSFKEFKFLPAPIKIFISP